MRLGRGGVGGRGKEGREKRSTRRDFFTCFYLTPLVSALTLKRKTVKPICNVDCTFQASYNVAVHHGRFSEILCSGLELLGCGVEPPVLVYRPSFLSENRL